MHKVQGLSLDTGVIFFDLYKQKYFNQGQMYVALSKLKNLENLFLIGTYIARAIKENVAAKLEYERMRNNQIKFLPKLMISDFSLTITFLNIRSIKTHMLDVLSDQHLSQIQIFFALQRHSCKGMMIWIKLNQYLMGSLQSNSI